MEATLAPGGPAGNERLRLQGTTAPGRQGRVRTYREGRVCDAVGCPTVLSRYNRQAYCWQHAPARPYNAPVRGRRPAPDTRVVVDPRSFSS